jgi:predicted aldo/keto reductase-like oxidoreductase
VDGCPAGIDIPGVFACFNGIRQKAEGAAEQYAALPVKPDACIGCGACEAICPQGLHIPELLKEVSRAF